jgi:hypothetical protein
MSLGPPQAPNPSAPMRRSALLCEPRLSTDWTIVGMSVGQRPPLATNCDNSLPTPGSAADSHPTSYAMPTQ